MEIKKKSLTKFLTFVALICSGAYILLSGSYNLVASNVVYASTFIPVAIELLITVFDLCAYAVCFSVFIFSIYRAGVKSSLPMVFIYSGILLAKILIDTTVGHIIFGTGWDLEGLIYALIVWSFDVLLAFAVVLIAHLCIKGKKDNELHFDKLYSSQNPLMSSALLVATVIAAINLISRIIFDIGYGAPVDVIDLLWMMAGYASDIISGAIVYVISFFVMKKLYKSENI